MLFVINVIPDKIFKLVSLWQKSVLKYRNYNTPTRRCSVITVLINFVRNKGKL